LGNHAFIEKYPDVKIYAHPEMIEEAKAGEAESWIKLMMTLTEGATDGTEATIPTIALENNQEVKIDNITIKAHLNKLAHTKTDAMYEIVEDKVLITGDNTFSKRMPRLDDGSYVGNMMAMDIALALDIKVVVPGHGPVGGKEVLTDFREFLYTIYDTSKKLLDDDMESFEMKPIIVEKLKKYQEWENFDGAIGKLISVAVLEAENE
jgi:glyoxylase-like metal-dependent hydrolase (beta-lactamase superfamily II)